MNFQAGMIPGICALAVGALALLAHPAALLAQRAKATRTTLDGLAWMTREAPGDRAAAEWLRANAPADARLVEAVGSADIAAHRQVSLSIAFPGEGAA